MNASLNPVCSKAVFPDEIDSGDEYSTVCEILTPVKCPKIEKVNLARNWREEALQSWKQNNHLFKTCKDVDCDPLKIFCGKFICQECKQERALAFSKLCLIWPKSELFNIFLDYVYFHAICVFDPNADFRFAKENPFHPYLLNYRRIRKFNGNLAEGISDMFQFSSQMKMSVRQHSQLSTVTGLKFPCEICGNKNELNGCRIFILNGRRYIPNTTRMIMRLKGEPSKQCFRLCKCHGEAFRIFFYVSHMDWLVHWNCYHRIQAVIIQSSNKLSAEEIIDSIEPYIFKNLALFFIKFYRHLNKCFVNPKLHTLPFIKEWKELVNKWKCGIVYQSSINLSK